MVETVLVLPVVALVLLLLLGLGRSMVRWQQVSMMDRYEAWRQVADAPGPAAGGADHAQLNEAFLRGRAVMIDVDDRNEFPELPARMLRDGAALYSAEAGWLADHVIERLPDGLRVRVVVSFEPSAPLEERLGFAGPLAHSHARLHHEWRYAGGFDGAGGGAEPYDSLNAAVRDYLKQHSHTFQALDTELERLESAGENQVAERIRDVYLNNPPYAGPDF